jgi:dolichol kinase
MQEPKQRPPLKKKVFGAVAIFVVSYVVFLFLWIQLKDSYGTAVTVTASKLLTLVKNVALEETAGGGGTITATFTPSSQREVLIDIPIKTSSYTFNVPLTFSFMTALFLFIRRKRRAYAEAVLILLAVHLLYVFSLELKTLTEILIQRGIAKESAPQLFISQFLWGFTDNMVIRFEPFLIGLYMFIRFGR